MNRATLALLAPVLAPAVAHAAPDNSNVPVGDYLHITCHAVARTPGAIGEARAVHFDLDDRVDVLVRVGGDLVYLSAPDPHQYSMICGLTGVTAFATPRLDGSWVVGAAAADANGLTLVRRLDHAIDDFLIETVSIGGAAWIGARALVTLDVDGDENDDVVGLDSTGTQLLVAMNQGGDVWDEVAPLPLGLELRGLELVTLGGQPALAGVAPGTAGDDVAAFDTSGSLVFLASSGLQIDDLVVLPDGVASDSFGLLSGDSVTVMNGAGVVEPLVDLSGMAPTALAAGDMDGDGDADLLANSTAGGYVTVLHRNTAASTTLDPTATTPYDLADPDADWSLQASAPLAADFDEDGDVDVFQFVDSRRYGALRRSARVDETHYYADLVDAQWNLTPSGSSVDLQVELPELLEGGAPHYLEVLLSSSPAGAGPDARHEFIAGAVTDISNVAPGEIAMVTLNWQGELGAEASVAFRAHGLDPSLTYIDRTGIEISYLYVSSGNSSRGTNNPIDLPPFPGEIPDRKLPPPPPVPIGLPPDRLRKPN